MESVTIQNISAEELETMIERIVRKVVSEKQSSKDEWVTGAKELSKRIGLGLTAICKKTNDGTFDGCYKRIGKKTILYNITKIKEL